MIDTPSQGNGLDHKQDRLDLLPLLQVIWKWKLLLLCVLIIAGGVTYLLVKQVDKLYESHTILYPSNSNSRDKQLEEFSYGYDIQSERLVQLLNSQHLMDSIINAFDLANTYQVDMSRPDGYDRLMGKVRKRFQYHKTRFSSVVISVQDEDPVRAARMANETARLVNIIHTVVMKENAIIALEAAERDYRKRTEAISIVNDSIKVIQDGSISETEARLVERIREKEKLIEQLRFTIDRIRQNHQIYDYGYQVNVLNEELAEARSIYLQEEGRLEILEPKLKMDSSVLDSSVLFARARMRGAKKRMDYFQGQLNKLSEVNATYISSQDHLEEQKELLLQAKLELEQLTGTLEPQIEIRSLSELESNYDWDQVQLRELQRNYQHALTNYHNPVPIAYVISYAKPSYKPIYPKVLTSVLLASLGTLSFALVILTLVERNRRGVS